MSAEATASQPPGEPTWGYESALDGNPRLAAAASELGVVDALLFRRVSPTTWAHLGGLGRGRGWAGIIDVDEGDDPLTARIPRQVGGVHRINAAEPTRILGPYYARDTVIVRTRADVAVVVGNPDRPLSDAPDEEFRELATMLDGAIDDVLPSKRLADELEVLHTVRALMDAPVDCGTADTLRHVVAVVTDALNCEIGVLRDTADRLTVVRRDAETPVDDRWRAVLDQAAAAMTEDQLLAQDVSEIQRVAPAVLELAPHVRALLAVPVPDPVGGLLLVCHTDRSPRGFNKQCQRLCRHVIETGTILTRTALLRDELRAAAEHAAEMARTDPLTGLGNRLAWDEALAQAQERVADGAVYSVLTVDVDGLKQINDAFGHSAGDDLLRHCADILRRHCSPADLAVRMGGDEFAILVPREMDVDDPLYQAFVTELAREASTPDAVAASVGVSSARPGGNVFDAVRDADIEMYKQKRRRRQQRASTTVALQR